MAEPTTWNEYTSAPYKMAALQDGQQIALWMTAYEEQYAVDVPLVISTTGKVLPPEVDAGLATRVVPATAPVRMVDMSRFYPDHAVSVRKEHPFPYVVNDDNFLSADTDPGATGDVFTVRLAPPVFWGPPSTIFDPQQIVLQTADGLYLTADSGGYYRSTVIEWDAAVFVLNVAGSTSAPRVTLSPTLYTFGQAQSATMPPNLPPYGSFSVGFVQPMRGGGVDENNNPIPIAPNGPILFKRAPGTPASCQMIVDLMEQIEGSIMPYGNGVRVFSPGNQLYLALDGEFREVPGNIANPLFAPVPSSSLPTVPASIWSECPIGEPLSADARLINVPGTPDIYFENDEVKRWIEDPTVLTRFGFNAGNVQSVTEGELTAMPSGTPLGVAGDYMPYADGTRVNETTTGKIYLVLDSQLRWVPNPATYNQLFANWSGILTQPTLSPTVYRVGPPITDGAYLAQAAAGQPIYLMIDITKRHITDPAAMARFNFNWNAVRIAPVDVDSAMVGADIDF